MSDWASTLNTPARRLDLDNPKVYDLPAFDGYQDPKKLDVLARLAEQSGRDPALATLAVQIFRSYGVQPRDYKGQAAALLRWVQNNIYYVNEPDERLQEPKYTLRVRYGDCFPADTLLLTDNYELKPIAEIEVGQKIWGYGKWSVVEGKLDKGVLPVTAIRLNNGSTMRLTENHKVYVHKCRIHGIGCALKNPKCESESVERIRVAELKEGAVLIHPDRIPFGSSDGDSDSAYIDGLYIADGSIPHKFTKQDGATSAYSFAIAGRDGHPKEAQKQAIASICEHRGIPYRITRKEIIVKDSVWAQRMLALGTKSVNKAARSLNLNEHEAEALLRGIMADSGKNTHGEGSTFTTTSRRLAVQVRVLNKMFGRTCGFRYIENHGGLGKNPIYRLNPRATVARTEKLLRVKSIEREVASVPCFDIQTDDHYVYLPEHDVTVSNCDDMAILLYALARSVRLPAQFVISGVDKQGRKRRYHQIDKHFPPNVRWGHIYIAIGDQPYGEPTWWYAEPTLKNVPLGWDVVGANSNALPELRAYGAPAGMPAAPEGGVNMSDRISSIAATANAGSSFWRDIAFTMVSAVAAEIALNLYREWKKSKKSAAEKAK